MEKYGKMGTLIERARRITKLFSIRILMLDVYPKVHEGQTPSVHVRVFTKAPAAALKLLGVSRVASSHSCQLLEVLAKLPEVRF